jgi:hypothetical protein
MKAVAHMTIIRFADELMELEVAKLGCTAYCLSRKGFIVVGSSSHIIRSLWNLTPGIKCSMVNFSPSLVLVSPSRHLVTILTTISFSAIHFFCLLSLLVFFPFLVPPLVQQAHWVCGLSTNTCSMMRRYGRTQAIQAACKFRSLLYSSSSSRPVTLVGTLWWHGQGLFVIIEMGFSIDYKKW